MTDQVLKTIESDDGRERVLIVRRPDGVHSYRRQWFSSVMNTNPDSPLFRPGEVRDGEWGPPGPYCGFYDGPEITVQEASEKVPWLRSRVLISLREIGWREWDPIGLLTEGEAWLGKPFANEYDAYLLEAAAKLRTGGSLVEATQYLLGIEREQMALGLRPGQQARAEATSREIQRHIESASAHFARVSAAPI